MKKGEPRAVVDRVINLYQARKESIERKCHPTLFEMAALWNESITVFQALGPNPPTEAIAAIQRRFEQGIEEIEQKYSSPSVLPQPKTFPAQTIFRDDARGPDLSRIADWIHFERHRVPLSADIQRRREKDWDSTHRLLRTVSDMEQLRCGKPIMPFKGNLEHWNMFEVLWGLGLEKLNPEELADFFDAFCPCTEEGHDPDALKKLRRRFKRAIGAELARAQNPAAG